uniref:MHC class I antigen n=1 Tax=Sphenodon punctatus TaxID=8508 RepID=A0A0F7CYH7_SPHPU|nr:MHC class I antigen [Sphenodon punctatus]
MGMWEATLLLLQLGVIVAPQEAGSRSHTLQYFQTAISEPCPGLPEFTVQGYVDGELFLDYDAEAQQMRPHAPWMQELEPGFWKRENHVHKVRQACFRSKVRSHMHLYNQSRGFHIFQYAYGCEIRENGTTGGFRQLGFDGEDFLVYDVAAYVWAAPAREAQVTQRGWNGDPIALQYYRNFLEEECIQALQRYLARRRERPQRREPPAMRVTARDSTAGGATLSCRAYGFYPREIALTWLRSGIPSRPRSYSANIVPNADGTYHAWATVDVANPKERELYRCYVEHESLSEPLIVSWESDTQSLLIPTLAAAVTVCGLVAVIAGGIWKKMQSGLSSRGEWDQNSCAKIQPRFWGQCGTEVNILRGNGIRHLPSI